MNIPCPPCCGFRPQPPPPLCTSYICAKDVGYPEYGPQSTASSWPHSLLEKQHLGSPPTQTHQFRTYILTSLKSTGLDTYRHQTWCQPPVTRSPSRNPLWTDSQGAHRMLLDHQMASLLGPSLGLGRRGQVKALLPLWDVPVSLSQASQLPPAISLTQPTKPQSLRTPFKAQFCE